VVGEEYKMHGRNCKILESKPARKIQLVRSTRKRKDIIKMHLIETGWRLRGMEPSGEEHRQQRAVENTVMNSVP
jgi:hypothetical protein